jgi:hypothetical protein
LDFVTATLLVLLGVFSGFLGGLLGIGGGILVVPILILAFDLRAQQAIGTSLVMIIFTALSGTFAYSWQKRLDWRIAAVGAVVTVPGAALGAYMTKFFSSVSLTMILAIFLSFIAAYMFWRSYHGTDSCRGTLIQAKSRSAAAVWARRITDASGHVFQYDASIYRGVVLLFLGGVASGFFGIGGGLIVVPVLASIVGLPMHIAIATSMAIMIFTSISGVATHVMLGHVLLEYAAPLVIGIVVGAQLGARTAKRLRSASLERTFALIVFALAIILLVTQL